VPWSRVSLRVLVSGWAGSPWAVTFSVSADEERVVEQLWLVEVEL
jgi:hypothetical protein